MVRLRASIQNLQSPRAWGCVGPEGLAPGPQGLFVLVQGRVPSVCEGLDCSFMRRRAGRVGRWVSVCCESNWWAGSDPIEIYRNAKDLYFD